MDGKFGALFLIIIVVIIASLIITAMAIFFPDALKQITDGASNLLTKGFGKAQF